MLFSTLFLLITSLNIIHSQFLPDRIYNKLEPRRKEPIRYVPQKIFRPLIRTKRLSTPLLSSINDNIDTYWTYISNSNDNYERQYSKYKSPLLKSTSTSIKKHPYLHCYSIYRTTNDDWCQDNCQLGNCPPSHCICNDKDNDNDDKNKSNQSKFIIKNKKNIVNTKDVDKYNNNNDYDDDDNDVEQKKTK